MTDPMVNCLCLLLVGKDAISLPAFSTGRENQYVASTRICND